MNQGRELMPKSTDPLIRAIELLEKNYEQIASEWNVDCHACKDILAFLREQVGYGRYHHHAWGPNYSGTCALCAEEQAARAAIERLEPKPKQSYAWPCVWCGGTHSTTGYTCPYPERRMDWERAERVLKDSIFIHAALSNDDYVKMWPDGSGPRSLIHRWANGRRTREFYDAILKLEAPDE